MKARRSTRSIMRRKPFFLVEALIAIALVLSVAVSLFSLEKNMIKEIRKASLQLQAITAHNRALSLLVEKLSRQAISFQTIEQAGMYEEDLSYLDWQAIYTFSIAKKAPKTAPCVFNIDITITVIQAQEEIKYEKKAYSFCITKKSI